MWFMMIIAYTVLSIVDTGAFRKLENKGQLTLYGVLMVVSCAIGIANGYVDNMPSPADAIKNLVMAIVGK